MNLRKNPRYAIAALTSMGVRLTPENRLTMLETDRYYLQATSAETNVMNVASSLGCSCLALTKFIQGSPISAFLKAQLRARNIHYEGAEVEQGGPWGYRHQFNISDSGYGMRAPRVWNDRAGEVGRTIRTEEFDLERIFGEEGVGILHLSGLIAAMSESTTRCCVEVARAAKAHGTLISFDLNYRASFWKGREQELAEAFREIAALSDILIGNEEDFQLCLGCKGPETGGKDLNSKISAFQGMIEQVRAEYPHVQCFATTLRQVVSANEHLWGAILLSGGTWYIEPARPIEVMDRIGGGDGFAGGLLYGILRGWGPEKWLQFGWASGVMAVSTFNDYAQPADEKQLWDIYAGNARVQR